MRALGAWQMQLQMLSRLILSSPRASLLGFSIFSQLVQILGKWGL